MEHGDGSPGSLMRKTGRDARGQALWRVPRFAPETRLDFDPSLYTRHAHASIASALRDGSYTISVSLSVAQEHNNNSTNKFIQNCCSRCLFNNRSIPSPPKRARFASIAVWS